MISFVSGVYCEHLGHIRLQVMLNTWVNVCGVDGGVAGAFTVVPFAQLDPKVNDSKEPPIEFGNFWLWGDPEGIQEAGILGLQFRDVQSKPLFPCLASIPYGTKVRSFPCPLYHLFGPNIRSIQYS